MICETCRGDRVKEAGQCNCPLLSYDDFTSENCIRKNIFFLKLYYIIIIFYLYLCIALNYIPVNEENQQLFYYNGELNGKNNADQSG